MWKNPNSGLLFGVGLWWLLYWIIIYAFDPHPAELFTLLDAVGSAISIGVLIVFAPGIVQGVREGRVNTGFILIVAICCTWFATMLRLNWQWAWRARGEPHWMLESPVWGFFIWILLTGGLLAMFAYEAVENYFPRRGLRRVGITVAIGLAFTFLGLAIMGGWISIPLFVIQLFDLG